MPQPGPKEYAPFYQGYIMLTKPYQSVPEVLHSSEKLLQDCLTDLPEQLSLYTYAPGKWTLKEVIQHLIDSERIFSYRALSVARGEQLSLPGFDENAYAAASGANYRKWEHLLEEAFCLRKSVIHLFRGFNGAQLQKEGIANQHIITPNALGFIIAGHTLHHLSVIKERYLNSEPEKLYA